MLKSLFPIRFTRTAGAALLLGSLVFSQTVACGGGGASGSGAAMPTSWPEVAKTPVFVSVEAADSNAREFVAGVESALADIMFKAGYTIVEDSKAAQAHAKVVLTAVEEKSMFTTMVNGKQQVNWKVTANVSMLGLKDASTIDKSSTQFTGSAGEVDQAAIANAIHELSSRNKLAAYEKKLDEAEAEAEQAVKDKEEKLWVAANADDCINATSVRACDGVKTYLRSYKDGVHAAEARKALEDYEAASKAQDDDSAWAKARADKCQKPSEVADCEGVQLYLNKRPDGAHADEAKKVLADVEETLKKLAKKEEAAAAKNKKTACVKACRREYERYTPGAYAILVNRCIRNECS